MPKNHHFGEIDFGSEPLNREAFADKLQAFLVVDHIFTQGSLVVSLEASFGSGKTEFLRMWTKRMQEDLKADADAPIPVLLNAWEDDFVGEPFLSLACSLLKVMDDLKVGDETKKAELKRAATEVGWFAVGVANSFVRTSTGLDFASGLKMAEERSTSDDSIVAKNLLADFMQKKNSLDRLTSALKQLLGSDEEINAIICVDELDRCRPDYAIDYLEIIKHVFDIPGIAFVLAIDKKQIGNSARCLFGEKLDADEYLRKFVHRRIFLPRPSREELGVFTDHCVSRFLVVPGIRESRLYADHLHKRIAELCFKLRFSLRQIESVFRTLGHLFCTEASKGELFPGFNIASIFLVCLQVYDSNLYDGFRDRQLSTSDLFKSMLGALGWSDAEFYICTCYYGLPKSETRVGFFAYLDEHGLLEVMPGIEPDHLAERNERVESDFAQRWGDFGEYPLQSVFQKIETASTYP